jgi:hypothetical protein
MNGRSIVLVAVLLSACSATPYRRHEIDWFQSRYYVTGMYGGANLDASGGDVDRGVTTPSTTSLDDEDRAWTVLGGYRFTDRYALEVGFANLGRVDSTVAAMPMNLPAFVSEVADSHPFLGSGVQVQGRWSFLKLDRVELSVAGGFWIWEAEVEVVTAAGTSFDIDEDGIDPTLGLAAKVGLADYLDLRLAWDRFYLDGDPADVFWAGFEIGLF